MTAIPMMAIFDENEQQTPPPPPRDTRESEEQRQSLCRRLALACEIDEEARRRLRAIELRVNQILFGRTDPNDPRC